MRGQRPRVNRVEIPQENTDSCKTAETLNFNSRKLLLFSKEEACVIARFLSPLGRRRNQPHGIQISGAAQVLKVRWKKGRARNISRFVLLTLIISLQPSYTNTTQCANMGERITSASPCKLTEGEVFHY